MSSLTIADDVRRYVLRRIPSVPYLEAILLLRDNAHDGWQAPQVARRLYLAEPEAQTLLSLLHANGIVQPAGDAPGCYRYAPETAELGELLDRLAVAYKQNLIAISTLIHSNTRAKAQLLAEAFVWRKGK